MSIINILKEIGIDNIEDILFKDKKFLVIKYHLDDKIIYSAYFFWNNKWGKVYQQENYELTFLKDFPEYYHKVLRSYVPVDKLLWRIANHERETSEDL